MRVSKVSKAVEAMKNILGSENIRIEHSNVFLLKDNAFYFYCNILSANSAYNSRNDNEWFDFIEEAKEFLEK